MKQLLSDASRHLLRRSVALKPQTSGEAIEQIIKEAQVILASSLFVGIGGAAIFGGALLWSLSLKW